MGKAFEVLRLIVRGDTKGAVDALKGLGTQARQIGSRLSSGFDTAKRAIFSLRGAIGTLGLVALFRSIVQATSEAQRVSAQLDAVLKSTGGAAGIAREEVLGLASELQKVTTFGDEAIIGLQNLLLTFGQVRGDNFRRATELILDMSTALGDDLNSSATQVGRALNDPIKGITALQRAGVDFSDAQERVIKRLVETGDIAAAQTMILDELAFQYGGSARAARETFGGALTALKEALGDLIEGDGEGLEGARQSVERLIERLQDPSTIAAFNDLATSLVNIADFGAKAAIALAAVAKSSPAPFQAEIDDLERQLEQMRESRRFDALRTKSEEREATRIQVELQEEIDFLKQQQQAALGVGTAGPTGRSPPPSPPPPPAPPVTLVDEDAEAEAERRQKAIDGMIESLREEAETHGLTAGQVALYRLEQAGASEAELERARTLAATVDANETAAEAAQELRRQQAEDQRVAEQQAAAEAEFAETIRQSIDPTRVYRLELEELERVHAKGLLTVDEFTAAQKRLQEEIAKAGDEQAEAISTFRDEARRNTQNILADGMETALTEGVEKGAEGALKAFAQMLLRMALQAQAAKIAEKLFGSGSASASNTGSGNAAGFFSQLISAFVAHDGGVAGEGSGFTRIAPKHIFGDARRYHFGGTAALGLSSDEVPAILLKGERVLNLDETREYERGDRGGDRLHMTVVTPSPQLFSRNDAQVGAAAASLMLRARNRNRKR